MKIGLIDVDSKIANLALMKISAWHKAQGDSVKWFDPLFDCPDLVYASKIFNFTPDYDYWPSCKIIRGGTGYDIKSRLPGEIENIMPDYSIYPACDYAMGFMTRGCINKCPWCIVPEKEGRLYFVQGWDKIMRPDCRDIVFLDNNALASLDVIRELERIIQYNRAQKRGKTIRIDFNQGLDARFINTSVAELLTNLHWKRFIRLACDTISATESVCLAISNIRRFSPAQEIFIYLLIKEDVSDAETRLRHFDDISGLTFFAQPYRDVNKINSVSKKQRDFARYVNVKGGEIRRKKHLTNI